MSQPISEDRVVQLTQENASVHSAPRLDRNATWMLVLITSMWGFSFTLMKNWQDAAEGCPGGPIVAGLTMVALRMFLALVVLGVFLPRLFRDPTRREFMIGLLLGGINSLGFVFQVTGLAWTSPALSAFVTSLASAWVPLLMLALFRLPVHRLTLAGLMVGIAGAGVLGIQTSLELTFGWGEMLTFISTWFFALMIVLLDRLGRGVESAHFTVAFLAGTGIPPLIINGIILVGRSETAPWINWTTTMLSNPFIWRDLILLTLLCTVLPFHWFNVYQPRVAASRAAVIYLLEPVFASFISIAWGHDVISPRLILGGGLILAGNALVEVHAWLRTFKPPV